MAGGRHALYVTLLAEYHARMIQHLNTMSFFDASKIPDLLADSNASRPPVTI
jgi:circadian clock protein KaiC